MGTNFYTYSGGDGRSFGAPAPSSSGRCSSGQNSLPRRRVTIVNLGITKHVISRALNLKKASSAPQAFFSLRNVDSRIIIKHCVASGCRREGEGLQGLFLKLPFPTKMRGKKGVEGKLQRYGVAGMRQKGDKRLT